MKKTVLLLLGLFGCLFSAFAQMLPDSTVQVVANWNVGDKLRYESENVKVQIRQRDTVVVERFYGDVEFEVVAFDEEQGYRFKAVDIDSEVNDPMTRILSNVMNKYMESTDSYFETTSLGSFVRALPQEGLESIPEEMLQEMVDSLAKIKPETAAMKPQMLLLFRQLVSPETIMQSVVTSYSPLFFFHGVKYDLGREYKYQYEAPALLGNQVVKMDAKFWVDEKLTDDFSAVLRVYAEVDEEDLKTFLVSFIGNLVKTMFPDENSEEAKAAVEEIYARAQMSMEDYMYNEIHLATGWPLNYGYTRIVKINVGGDDAEIRIDRSFRAILDND